MANSSARLRFGAVLMLLQANLVNLGPIPNIYIYKYYKKKYIIIMAGGLNSRVTKQYETNTTCNLQEEALLEEDEHDQAFWDNPLQELPKFVQNFSDNTWTVQLVLKDSCQSTCVFLSFCGSVICFSPTCCRVRACLGLGLQNVDREVVGLKMILVCISLTWISLAKTDNGACILCSIIFSQGKDILNA